MKSALLFLSSQHPMAVYVKDRVVAAEMDKALVRAVVLASGERVAADAFVNAAGAWSGEAASMLGMKLPVTPMRRFEHYFTAGSPIERLPYVTAPTRGRRTGATDGRVHLSSGSTQEPACNCSPKGNGA
jgi:glycine/D-amino acid oxidase-like deaminating enzyme